MSSENDETGSPVGAAVARTETESEISRLISEFPQDASDEAFTMELKKRYHCKKLRAACTQLGLHPQANPTMNHKDGYMKLLAAYRRAQLRGEIFIGNPRTKPKRRINTSSVDVDDRTKHCGLKLINVVFSPPFIGRIVESGALPSTGLEIEPVDGRAKYWRDVATAYASGNSEFNRIAGPPGRYEGIDPKVAPHHSPAKLCAIWKDVTTKYEDTFSRWKQLGTDHAGFAHFCGDLDVLYLHDRLQIQPLQVNVDRKEFSVRKRVRTEDIQPRSESVDTASEEEMERGNFLTLRELEVPTQRRVPSTDGQRDSTQQRFHLSSGEVLAATQHQDSTLSGAEIRQRRLLPRSDAVLISVQHPEVRTEVQVVPPQDRPREQGERIQHIQDTDPERRRVKAFEGVIYSSQAVRDTMAAIDALKRGRFDNAVIAQAEESMDAIVQVWLGELDKAAQPQTGR